MKSWDGPINYISHHDIPKPASISTKLRIVSNSSLGNNNSGIGTGCGVGEERSDPYIPDESLEGNLCNHGVGSGINFRDYKNIPYC